MNYPARLPLEPLPFGPVHGWATRSETAPEAHSRRIAEPERSAPAAAGTMPAALMACCGRDGEPKGVAKRAPRRDTRGFMRTRHETLLAELSPLILVTLLGCESRRAPTTVPTETGPSSTAVRPADGPTVAEAPGAANPLAAAANPPAATEDPPVTEPPPEDDVVLAAPLDLGALARLGVPLPAISRDGSVLAIQAADELDDPAGARTFEVWVFALAHAGSDYGVSPAHVLPLVTTDDARQAVARPTERTRARILRQVHGAVEQLSALGYDEPLELADDYDLVERGDVLRKRWKLGRFTITESNDGTSLLVKKGKTLVTTLSPPYGPEDEGQCLQFLAHEVFPTPDGQRWLVLTYIDGPPALGCEHAPRLRVMDPP